ncbi:MAG: hypothetical protein ACOC8K_05660, partial [Gemmatimonadota bacterium]
MRRSFQVIPGDVRVLTEILLPGAAFLLAGTLLVAPSRPLSAQSWQVPRTVHGHPDLQGNWTNVTLTPFQREEGQGPVYTPEE